MIIFWHGSGGLVIVFGVLAALITNIVTSKIFNETNYFQTHSWAQAVALWLAGVGCWFVGRTLNGRPGRTEIDETTGAEVTLKPNHSLLLIKLEYWGPILFVIGCLVLLLNR
jgi:hypothetical protein